MVLLCSANAMAITHNASSVTLTTGTWDSGNVTSTWVKGDIGLNNTYNWSGVGGVPGFDIRFNVSGVTANRNSYDLVFYATGTGGTHIIRIQVYNFTGHVWTTIGTAPEFVGYDWENNTVYSQDYISSNKMWIRAYHSDSGNAAEDFSIDYFQVIESDILAVIKEYDVGSCPITTTASTLLYCFIGILLIAMFVIGEWTRVPIFNILTGVGMLFYSFPLYGCDIIYGGTITIFAIMIMGYAAFWKWK